MPITKYLWDDQNYLQETDENDVTQVTYTNRPDAYGQLVSQRRARESGSEFFHYDGLGSTTELSDENEDVTESYRYDAFGNLTTTNTYRPPFVYVGESGYYNDQETDDYYVRARQYSPRRARWYSVDPLRFFADDFNSYRYVQNQPIALMDPSGTEACCGSKGPASVSARTPPGIRVLANEHGMNRDHLSSLITLRFPVEDSSGCTVVQWRRGFVGYGYTRLIARGQGAHPRLVERQYLELFPQYGKAEVPGTSNSRRDWVIDSRDIDPNWSATLHGPLRPSPDIIRFEDDPKFEVKQAVLLARNEPAFITSTLEFAACLYTKDSVPQVLLAVPEPLAYPLGYSASGKDVYTAPELWNLEISWDCAQHSNTMSLLEFPGNGRSC